MTRVFKMHGYISQCNESDN